MAALVAVVNQGVVVVHSLGVFRGYSVGFSLLFLSPGVLMMMVMMVVVLLRVVV